MTIATKAEEELAALKAYLAKVWKEAEHGFDTVEEAIEAAIHSGKETIANQQSEDKAPPAPATPTATPPVNTSGATTDTAGADAGAPKPPVT